MGMLQGIIFDLDGVICHTDELHYLAWKSIADELGIAFDREKNNRLRGVGRMESLELLLGSVQKTAEEKAALAARKNARYVELLQSLTPDAVSEEVKNALSALSRRKIRRAIGSSSKNARLILERLALTDRFDAICDGNQIAHSKPHPEVFLKAAERLGLAPDACAVVEDAPSGIDAAKAGGFYAFGVGEAARYGKTDCALPSVGALPDRLF